MMQDVGVFKACGLVAFKACGLVCQGLWVGVLKACRLVCSRLMNRIFKLHYLLTVYLAYCK